MAITASEIVTLAGGLAVSLPALRLLWALEERGLHVRLDGDAVLVGPNRALSDEDRQAIRRYRDELRALVAHCERVARV